MSVPSRKLSRLGGTTLIEVLVVIVVFLVGILAIAQIFPGGIRILNRARDNSVAVALARSQEEAMKSRPDLVPEAILPVRFVLIAGVYTPIVDSTISNTEYSPQGTGIDSAGIVQGTNRPWQLQSGPNVFRRIIGETHRISAPRYLTPASPMAGDPYGCFTLLEYGPPDHTNGVQLPGQLLVYGRDMFRRMAKTTNDYLGLQDYEYAVGNANSNLVEIAFPASPTVSGNFRVSLTATINNGGNIFTRTLTSQTVTIAPGPGGYSAVPISTIPGVLGAGETLVNVEINSIRIARLYRQIANGSAWDPNEIFTYQVTNPVVGELIFNPGLYGKYEERAGASRQPYVARIDYDVRDWRIIHEDLRISSSSPAGLAKVIKLQLPSIRTNSVKGPDGLQAPEQAAIPVSNIPNQGMEDVCVVRNSVQAGANLDDVDNLLLIDVETGGQVLESYNGVQTVRVDKTNGYVTLFDYDNDDTNGLTEAIMTPGGNVQLTNVTGRVFRAYYMSRQEWAVQIARNPAHYDFAFGVPGAAQYYIGGTGAINGSPSRLYFPTMDNNRKVSIGRIRYTWNDGTQHEGLLEGAEFRIKFRPGSDTIAQPLPSIDLYDVFPVSMTGLAIAQDTTDVQSRAYSIADVRGVSVLTKVFYNGNGFTLGTDPVANLTKGFGNWSREWSVTTKETYLHRGDAIQ